MKTKLITAFITFVVFAVSICAQSVIDKPGNNLDGTSQRFNFNFNNLNNFNNFNVNDFYNSNLQNIFNATTSGNNTGSVSGNSTLIGNEGEVVNLVNNERQKKGLQALTINNDLSNVARTKSQDMANKNYFSHNSPTYGSPFQMMKSFGIKYSTAAENLAYSQGQTSVSQIFNGWMNSQGHKKNILNSEFTQTGIGIVKNSQGKVYWTQMFIKP